MTKALRLHDKAIAGRIYRIRGEQVMLDSDLAELYGVETRVLNLQVSRNRSRFPKDFMFRLTDAEWEALRSQIVISKAGRGGRRYAPLAFTEHGVLMLSSVLRSERAIKVNIQIMRVFVKMNRLLMTDRSVRQKMELMEARLSDHGQMIEELFFAVKELMTKPEPSRKRLGYRGGDDV